MKLKPLATNKYLSIPNLKASTERERGNPILPTRFAAILGSRGQEMLRIGRNHLSRWVVE